MNSHLDDCKVEPVNFSNAFIGFINFINFINFVRLFPNFMADNELASHFNPYQVGTFVDSPRYIRDLYLFNVGLNFLCIKAY